MLALPVAARKDKEEYAQTIVVLLFLKEKLIQTRLQGKHVLGVTIQPSKKRMERARAAGVPSRLFL